MAHTSGDDFDILVADLRQAALSGLLEASQTTKGMPSIGTDAYEDLMHQIDTFDMYTSYD